MREWNGQYSTWGNFYTFGTSHCRVTKHISVQLKIYKALSTDPATTKNILGISEIQINMLETTNYIKLL
jgi:hypothetical protein